MKLLCKLLFVIVSWCALCPAFGQEISDVRWIARDTSATAFQVTAFWKKGEKKKFRARKFDRVYKNDSLVSEKTVMDAIMEFEVADSTGSSYGLIYRMLQNKKPNAGALTTGLPVEQLDIQDNELALHYSTDSNGMLKSYTNRTEVEGKLDQIMQMIKRKQMEGLKDKSEAERKVIATVGEKAANGRALFSLMYETFVSQFHNLHGYTTGINDTLNYRESVIHPLTNKPISFDCYLYVSAIDTLGVVRFDTEKYADMKEFVKDYAAFMQTTREANGLKRDKNIEKEAAEMDMQMNTFVTTVIDTESGWPIYIKVNRLLSTKQPQRESELRDEVWELDNDLEDR